jgi:hypothetical protein
MNPVLQRTTKSPGKIQAARWTGSAGLAALTLMARIVAGCGAVLGSVSRVGAASFQTHLAPDANGNTPSINGLCCIAKNL